MKVRRHPTFFTAEGGGATFSFAFPSCRFGNLGDAIRRLIY